MRFPSKRSLNIGSHGRRSKHEATNLLVLNVDAYRGVEHALDGFDVRQRQVRVGVYRCSTFRRFHRNSARHQSRRKWAWDCVGLEGIGSIAKQSVESMLEGRRRCLNRGCFHLERYPEGLDRACGARKEVVHKLFTCCFRLIRENGERTSVYVERAGLVMVRAMALNSLWSGGTVLSVRVSCVSLRGVFFSSKMLVVVRTSPYYNPRSYDRF